MARKNLLNKRGTRPREAQDEYGIRRRAAGLIVSGKELAREPTFFSCHTFSDLIDVVGISRAHKCIALAVLRERFFVSPDILERLTEREMQKYAILIGQIVAREFAAHRLHIGGPETKGLEIGKPPPPFAEARFELDGFAVGGNTILLPS